MEKGQNKAKRRLIISCIVSLSISLAFFVGTVYLVTYCRAQEVVDDSMVTVCKILALTGVFFLVVAFGHILPALFSRNSMCDENVMRQAFSKYIPYGETLEAGIYATVRESKVSELFRKCRCEEGMLIPDDNAGILSFNKEKYHEYNVFMGVTQSQLLIVECEKNKHFYDCSYVNNVQNANIREITTELSWDDIGISFPLESIKQCKVKKGLYGSLLWTITMENGSYFKVFILDNAGPNGNMPHHIAYRDAIFEKIKNK